MESILILEHVFSTMINQTSEASHDIHITQHDYDSGETVIIIDTNSHEVESAEVFEDSFLLVINGGQMEGELPRDGEKSIESNNGIVTITIRDDGEIESEE